MDLPDIDFDETEEIIHYFEERGDFINTTDSPALIDAWDVNTRRTSYVVIDIRSRDEFLAGHIPDAINVNHSNLLTVLDTLPVGYRRVVIVSKNGQSSSYYAALLRFYGYNNVYAMNFGMAAWNVDFADDWLNALTPPTATQYTKFTGDTTRKGIYTGLPVVDVNQSLSIESRIKERVTKLMLEEFPETPLSYTDEQPSISRNHLLARDFSKDYIVCFGARITYVEDDRGIGHIIGAVHYDPPPYSAFTSSKDLQTLPANKKIFIYGYTGSESAFLIAYLRILGYDAVSMLFGFNTLFPNTADSLPRIGDLFFTESKIMNFPYEK